MENAHSNPALSHLTILTSQEASGTKFDQNIETVDKMLEGGGFMTSSTFLYLHS